MNDRSTDYVALRWPPYHVLFHTGESEAAYDDLRERVLVSVRESLAAMDIEVVEEPRDDEATEREHDLEPPYCQVVGRNAVVLLTPEQIAWIIREASSYPVKNDMAMGVLAEMRRAELALKRSATRAEAEQSVEVSG